MLHFIVFCLGTVTGSFLNVCIYRIPLGKSIIYPPSCCENCGHRLKPLELVPIISYISLAGRCRECGSKISLSYPIVEVITGILFLCLFNRFGLTYDLLSALILVSILIISTFTDIEHSIIPNKIVVPGMAAGFLTNILLHPDKLPYCLLGFLLGGGSLLLLAVISRGGMGGGDIKLFAMIGIFFGLKLTALSLLLAFILGSIGCLICIIFNLKKPKDTIPFGPFIALASIISLFFGNGIISWYLEMFF